MASRQKAPPPRGRSGGRSGGSGYDYQDLYVALHLAELLVGGTRDPLREVLWEKKAIDAAGSEAVESVHVDDLILLHQSGKWVYVQLKEHAPRGGWSMRHLIEHGVADQFWKQWNARPTNERRQTTLRLSTSGDVAPIRDLVDVALRSRTPRELLSDEGSASATGSVAALAEALGLRSDGPELLAFLRALDAEQLPDASGLDAWIARALVAFGEQAPQVVDRLVRLVGESKHAGRTARASYTREALLDRLLADGMPIEQLIGAGVQRAAPLTSAVAWSTHRTAVVRRFGTFRLYGLEAAKAIFADLLTLFVAPRLAPAHGGMRHPSDRERMEREHRRMRGKYWRDGDRPDDRDFHFDREHGPSSELEAVLSTSRRFGFVAGPGTGKTTTLRWLALVSAMESDDGRRRRVEIGLPAAPLIPIYVSFREFARRVRSRELEGVPGRVGLVADFLAAQLESGLVGIPPSRERALQVAQWLLESGETFLLFDGLDEVPDAGMRETLFAAVTDLVQTYEAPRVVIATRPSGIRALHLSTKLPFFEPLPLDDTRRTTFARQWYRAVRDETSTLFTLTDAETRGADLANAADALSDLTSNPLLLSILALIHFNRGGVPVDRATLYDHATSAMLGHWDRDIAGRDLGDDALPRNWSDVLRLTTDQIREVMEEIGWRLHAAQQAELGVADMEEALSEAIAAVAPLRTHAPKDRAAVLIQLLSDRSGLLLEREPGVLSFLHLSFRDYLAARYRVRIDGSDLRPLAALAADDAHDEVLRFAFGILRLLPPRGVERARDLLTQIAMTAPTLAASALLDVPEIELPPATIDHLAQGVWIEAEHGPSNPRTAARLLHVLLSRSAHPDRLLLSLLAHTAQMDHHHMSELPVRAFLERPKGPLDPDLAWVLRRLTALPLPDPRRRDHQRGPHEWHMQTHLHAVATLLLVESDGVDPADNVDALARLLGDHFPGTASAAAQGPPEARATRILVRALTSGTTRKIVQTRLRSLATAKTPDIDRRAVVNLLIEAGSPATAGTVHVLISAFDHAWERDDAVAAVERWRADPASTATITRALERAFHGESEGARRTAGRLLSRVDLPMTPSTERSSDEREEQDRIARVVALLNEPATAEETRAILDDELWDEHAPVAWQAARALAAAGHIDTPGLAQALVRVGFASEARQPIASDVLRTMLHDPRVARATRAALLEGTKNSTDRVAAVSALFLLESGGTEGDPYLARNLKAALRDTSSFQHALPHIETLLAGEDKDATLDVLLEYVGNDKANAMIAGHLSILLAEHGPHDTGAVIRALAMFGCAHEEFRPKAMTLLRDMLDNRDTTTEVRRALGQALEAKDRDVTWGAARLFCERGSFTDRRLPDVLASTGLDHRDASEREAARAWIADLLARPRIAKRMREALERAIGRALQAEPYNKKYGLAWEAARCLVAANAFEADELAETLVTGGFGERQRHDDAMTFLTKVSASKAELAADIEAKLWNALEHPNNGAIRWGAACALLDIFTASVREIGQRAIRPASDEMEEREPDEDAEEALSAFAALVRVLLNEDDARAVAQKRIDDLLLGDLRAVTRRALAHLLAERTDDAARTTAFLAAECLLRINEYTTKHIASAIIEGGLREDDVRDRASSALDALRGDPTTVGLATDALGSALWSPDGAVSAAAAEYHIRRGDGRSSGVVRGLIRALPRPYRRGWNPHAHLAALLRDGDTRDAAIGALGAAIFDDREELQYDATRLLVESGGPITTPLLDILDHVARFGTPIGPLALLASTDRIEEVRSVAGGTRSALADLVGDAPD